jgi:hypothetical protein
MKTEDAAMPEVSTAETAGMIREVCEAVFQEMLQPEAEPVVPDTEVIPGLKPPKPKSRKRRPQRIASWVPDYNAWRQPLVTTVESVDAMGVLTRIRTTEGERPPLQGERPQL